MRVLLLNQFFHPDLSATAQIATDLAEDLAESGVKVTVLASRGTYLGGKPLPARERHRDIEIVRVSATSLGKRTLLHRAVDYLSFYLTASCALARLPRHDVVLALTTPPLIAATGLVAKALKGSKLVYWVQDLYPDVAIAFGALRAHSLTARTMGAVSRAVMRRADRVIALGEEMACRCIAAGAAPGHTVVIPNWSDAAAVRPISHEVNGLRRELARGARFLVMYSGNMGRGHDIDTLLGAARQLSGDPRIRFVFVGDGAKRGVVEAAAKTLPNLRLVPYQPRERLAESLSAGDAHLISLSPEIEGLIEPSKLYGIMAAGRPSLFVGPERTEVARTIERERCGRVLANGDVAGLAATIRELSSDPASARELGRNARQALEDRYARTVCTRRIRELLLGLCANGAEIGAPARSP